MPVPAAVLAIRPCCRQAAANSCSIGKFRKLDVFDEDAVLVCRVEAHN